jgi:hypothetical protein
VSCKLHMGVVLWACANYDLPVVDTWPHRRDHNQHTPLTQNNAWVAYKALTTLQVKKTIGPTHDKFSSCRQPHTLPVGQSDTTVCRTEEW